MHEDKRQLISSLWKNGHRPYGGNAAKAVSIFEAYNLQRVILKMFQCFSRFCTMDTFLHDYFLNYVDDTKFMAGNSPGECKNAEALGAEACQEETPSSLEPSAPETLRPAERSNSQSLFAPKDNQEPSSLSEV